MGMRDVDPTDPALKHHEIEWDSTFVSIEAFDVGSGRDSKMPGHIRIVLSDGRSLETGKNVPRDTNPTKGTLIGISGKYRAWVSELNVHTLASKPNQWQIHDVEFQPAPDEVNKNPDMAQRGLVQQTLRSAHFVNEADKESDWLFQVRDQKETSTSWTHSVTPSSKYTLDGFWEQKRENTNTEGYIHIVEIRNQMSGKVAPGKSVHVWAYNIEGQYGVEWKGKLTIKFENGKEFTYPTNGRLKGVEYSDVSIHSEDESREAAMEAVANGEEFTLFSNLDLPAGRNMSRMFRV
ncbi:hypothetical protein EJ04DRAFT_558139 [Polyplosphaeria fusca]|uniref:Uncharacterized protein n=1 Tax=Polyplosphaeria fusca TaxID=682080 RepID=A0A9P4RDX7_9PLEO|nr:hypothetical protein EJ04DRAFT_558139 [Polyplosphaeria fusca]